MAASIRKSIFPRSLTRYDRPGRRKCFCRLWAEDDRRDARWADWLRQMSPAHRIRCTNLSVALSHSARISSSGETWRLEMAPFIAWSTRLSAQAFPVGGPRRAKATARPGRRTAQRPFSRPRPCRPLLLQLTDRRLAANARRMPSGTGVVSTTRDAPSHLAGRSTCETAAENSCGCPVGRHFVPLFCFISQPSLAIFL